MPPELRSLQAADADERWLAFSKDAYYSLDIDKQRQLEKICRHHGVGLLVVFANGRVGRLAKARFHWDWWHDYLRFYSKEEEIRAAIKRTHSTTTSSTNTHAFPPAPACHSGQMPIFPAVMRM